MKSPIAISFWLLLLSAAPIAPAGADLIATINTIRAEGCAGHAGVREILRRDSRLDHAAQALTAGRSLRDATEDAGYRALQSAVLEVSGDDASIPRTLAKRGCRDIADSVYRDVGVAERGDMVWVVLAAPFVPPQPGDSQAVSRRLLELVNDARAERRRCGWTRYDAVPPLVLSDALHRAALAHARDMAGRGGMGHTGSDGSTPAERATRAGYRWRLVGENVAAGQATPEQAVAEWLGSPRHCANIMDPDFTEMGAGYALEAQGVRGIYWAQVFGTPRR